MVLCRDGIGNEVQSRHARLFDAGHDSSSCWEGCEFNGITANTLPTLSTWIDQRKYSRISQGEETSESEGVDEDEDDNVTTPLKIDIDTNMQHLVLCVHL